MQRTIRSEKPSCLSVSAHTRPAAPEQQDHRSRPRPLFPSKLPLSFIFPTPTCTHYEHVGAAAVAGTWRDTLGHHLCPSLQLQGLRVGKGSLICIRGSSPASSPPYNPIPSHTRLPSTTGLCYMLFSSQDTPPPPSLFKTFSLKPGPCDP